MAISALTSADIFPTDGSVRIDFTQVDDEAIFAVNGTEVMTNKGPAVYCKVGAGNVIAGSYCALSQVVATGVVTATEEDTTTSGSAPRKGCIAIAPASANKFAWFLRGPFDRVPVDVANSVSSLAAATTTGTAGQLGAGGDTVLGLYLIEASGASGLTACSAALPLGTNI
jgi:hypothetical protein